LIFCLVLLNGDSKGKRFELEPGKISSIGRDASCVICLNDKLLSKHHADIGYEDGRLMITDLDSMNGTFVNGKKISRKILNEGDNITIGVSVFRVTPVGFSDSDSVVSIAPDEMAVNAPSVGVDAINEKELSPRLSEYIHSIQQIVSMQSDNIVRQSLKRLFHILPVSRVAIFNVATDGQMEQGYTVYRQTGGKSANMSRSFALKVLESGKATLIKDASGLQQEGFADSQGFRDVHCIIGVPVHGQGTIRAVILADNLQKPAMLTDEHMRIMQFAGKTIEILYQADAVNKLNDMKQSLPVCHVCGKVRGDQGYWQQLETFVAERTTMRVTHGCCPECAHKIIQS